MTQQRKRVGIAGLLQESNTFIRHQTSIEEFRTDTLFTGEAVRGRFEGTPHEMGGFFVGLEAAGLEAVPIFGARAMPYGVMTPAARAELLRLLDEAIERAGPLDGLLVAPHGATVAEDEADFDGHWVQRLRDRFGARFPIVGTLDLHANVSRRLIAAGDAWFAYRTNPHLDQRATGEAAALLLAHTLRGEIRPTTAAEFLPLVVNIERQLTADDPCRALYAAAAELGQRPGVLAVSLLLGFPYADVPQLGSAVIVTTDNDPDLARSTAAELADRWWRDREQFLGQLINPDEALRDAANGPWPVGLLDMGDNVGGGSPGDGTVLAAALAERELGPAFACLYDPVAVSACQTAGIGNGIQLTVGGHSDRLHGEPMRLEAIVRGLFDGKFSEREARHGGAVNYDQGPTALIEAHHGRLTLMLTSRRMAPFSIGQLTGFGIDPEAFRYLVLKGVHAPVAAYAPHCRRLIRVNTPGVTTADLERLTFEKRRRPLYPFETDFSWKPDGTRQ